MVRKALVAAGPAALVALAAGWAAGGWEGGVSALLGVVVVVLNFAVHGFSLAWAAGISVPAVQATALGGFVLRMGAIAGVLFVLDRAAFFSPVIFALAAVAGTFALLAYEVRLVRAGLGATLEVPADPAAVRASEALRLKERTS